MATITTRAGKGSPLTNTEVDANFTNINSELGQKLTGNQTVTLSGDATGSGETAIAVTLANSGVTAGSYGSASAIPVITVDAKGRLTTVSTSAVSIPSGSLTFTGDVTGSGNTGSSTALTLANSGATAGTYTKVTVDAKGRVTTGSSLASSDVTTALGFTPYNSSNPSGYITSSSLSSYLPLSGGTLTGTLTGTTGRFQKNQTAGDYTTAALWTESYGNTATGIAFHISGNVGKFLEMRTNGILYWNGDTVIHSGNYNSYALPLSGGTLTGSATISGNGNGLYFTGGNNRLYFSGYRAMEGSTNGAQLQIGESYSATYLQSANNYATTSNHVILHAGNYTSYSPSLTGSGASGTWGINITGSHPGTHTSELTAPNMSIGNQSRSSLNAVGGNIGSTTPSWNNSQLEIKNTDAGTVAIAFHRAGYTSNTIDVRDGSGIRIDSQFALHAGNYNSYAPSLTGSGASGTWGINVTGYSKWIDRVPAYQWSNATLPSGYNSGVETSFVSAGQGFPHYGVVLSVMGRVPADPGGNFQLYMGHGTNYGGTSLHVRSVDQSGNVWTSWKPILDSSNFGSYALPLSGGTLTGALTINNADLLLNTGGVNTYGLIRGYPNFNHLTTFRANITGSTSTPTYTPGHQMCFVEYAQAGDSTGWFFKSSEPGTYLEVARITRSGINWSGNTVLHAGNYTSYSPSLTGSGASGTWGINITGNAATATSADQIDGWGFRNTGSNSSVNADTIESNGITYYTAGVPNFSGNSTDGALYSQMYSTSWQHQIAADYRSGQIALRGKNNGTWQSWRTVLDSSNFSSYAVPLGGGTMSGRLTISPGWTTSGRNYSNEWIEFGNHSGLYSPHNGAHFYPNNGSYGSWRIAGSRNGWVGLEFDSGAGNTSLMVNADTCGFHANSYGWRFRVIADAAYIYTGTHGGGTERVMLHAGNFGSYALPLTGGTLTGAIYVGTSSSGSAARALRIGPSGSNPASFGSYAGSWRSTIEIWDNAATRMLHLTPPDGTNYNYSSIKSIGAGLRIDVGGDGGTNAVDIGTNGVANFPQGLQQGGNQVLHAGNYTSYTLPLGGGWYGSGMPGYRAYGVHVGGGEFVLGNGLPNAGQVGVLIDGAYVAGENNGFWSLSGDNTWGGRRGMYWDGTYLNFTTNGATTRHSAVYSDGNVTSYAYRGNGNVAGTGEAIYAPAGVYSTGTNWLYGTVYLNGNALFNAGYLRLDNGFEITKGGSNYGNFNSWVHLGGHYGFYSSTNNAHFYPNNGSYGSWRIDGSRNGWRGIEFEGNSSLMMNDGTYGFHRNVGGGWGFYVEGGNGYFPGNVTAYWSDERLKTNIRRVNREALDILRQFRAHRFNWNEKVEQYNLPIAVGKEEVGLIAQHVEKVLPDAVVVNKSANKVNPDGTQDELDYLTINYDKITPLLVEGVNIHEEEIVMLKEEIGLLRALIESVSKKVH